MNRSIFDSKSERLIYNRLKTYWSKYVDIFAQVPPSQVFGYNEIIQFTENEKVADFLHKTSFDFVVCELKTGIPILVVEFDGLSGGFSTDGNFYIKSLPNDDLYRKLKMETKLSICERYQIPMIVVSYNESDVLPESGDYISILDAIIGDSLEKHLHKKNYQKNIEILTEEYKNGGQESFEIKTIEIDTNYEQYNPVKQKIKEITKGFLIWPMQIIFPVEEHDWLTGRFSLQWEHKIFNGSLYTKKLITIDLKIRKVGVFNSDCIFLFNTIGEYCLARKTERELGNDMKKWQQKIDSVKFSK